MQLSAPAAAERGAILKYELHKRALLCPEDVLEDIAAKCDGYDAYDLVRTVLAVLFAEVAIICIGVSVSLCYESFVQEEQLVLCLYETKSSGIFYNIYMVFLDNFH